MKGDIQALAVKIFESVQTYCAKEFEKRFGEKFSPVADRLDQVASSVEQVAQALKELPTPKDGKDGRDGVDGATPDIDQIAAKAAALVPPPGPGPAGADADPELVKQLVEQSVAALGEQALAPEAIAPIVAEQVRAAVAELPEPAAGRDGKDADPELIKQLVEQTVTEISSQKLAPEAIAEIVDARVKAAVEKLPAAPAGRDGVDADPDAIAAKVLEKVAATLDEIPVPKDGRDGRDGVSVDLEQVQRTISDLVSKIPPAPAGKDGENGKDGRDAVIDPADVEKVVADAVAKLPPAPAGADGKDGLNGADVDPEQVKATLAELVKEMPAAVGKDGSNGKDGLDGTPGKSAYEIACDSGYEGSEADWLTSLRGANGEDGDDGDSVDPETVQAMVRDEVKRAVDAMPKPENGKSVTAEDVEPLINERVDAAVKALPTPAAGKDGVDGQDGKNVELAEVEPLIQEAVAVAVKALPAPEPGPAGKEGENGRDADPQAIKNIVTAAVAELPPALTKEAAAEQISEIAQQVIAERLEQAIKAIPAPVNGKDGQNGQDGKDGRDADEELVKQIVGKAIEQVAPGRDGRDGKTGADGRDAIHVTILPSVDVTHVYPRGTWAKHSGGLMSSFRTTDPIGVGADVESAGWTIIMDPVVRNVCTQSEDKRTFEFKSYSAFGKEVSSDSFSVPVMIYRGVYSEEKSYELGDIVTWGGSMWHCQKDTTARPGAAVADWKLTVKKGEAGRDGIDGKQGEQGRKGDPGRAGS